MGDENLYMDMKPTHSRRSPRHSLSETKQVTGCTTNDLDISEEVANIDGVHFLSQLLRSFKPKTDEAFPYAVVVSVQPDPDDLIYSAVKPSRAAKTDLAALPRVPLDSVAKQMTGNKEALSQLEDIFPLQDTSAILMKERKYDEAFKAFGDRYKLSPSLFRAKYLLDFYVAAMRVNRGDQAVNVRNDIVDLLQNEVQANPASTKAFARRCLDKHRYFEAMLFYQAAAALYCDKPDSSEQAYGIRWCALGMKNAAELLLKQDPTLKALVQLNVAPLMKEMLLKIQAVDDIDIKIRCVSEAWCLHYIGIVEGLVANWVSFEMVVTEALKLLRALFKADVIKLQIYGACLNNLAYVYSNTSRKKEAVALYTQAIDAKKRAGDYSSDLEKQKDIQLSEINLKKAKESSNSK